MVVRDQGEEFFEEPLAQSIVKANIVAKYFYSWAKNMVKYAPKQGFDLVQYIDFCSGPGCYETGEESTPLLVMRSLLAHHDFHDMVQVIFNDKNPVHIDELRSKVMTLSGVDVLKHTPRFYSYEITRELEGMFDQRVYPAYVFLDPLGYKALISKEFIASTIRHWGCDCVFFFNYRRVNRDLSNHVLVGNLYPLFGQERVESMRARVSRMNPQQRERYILREFRSALGEVGIKHPLLYRVHHRKVDQTSHYLVFLSKAPLAHHLMKDVMAGFSTRSADNVPQYEYLNRPPKPVMPTQIALNLGPVESISSFSLLPDEEVIDIEVEEGDWSIERLKSELGSRFAGERRQVKDVYHKHQMGTPYFLPNYKAALLELEEEGAVQVDKPRESRWRNGKLTLGDDRWVTFSTKRG